MYNMTNNTTTKEYVLIHHKHRSTKKGKNMIHRKSCVTLSWLQSKIKHPKNSEHQDYNSFDPSWKIDPVIKLCSKCKPQFLDFDKN